MAIRLPCEEVLTRDPAAAPLEVLGRSRQGREIRGAVLGRGDLHVSLIGGCHADEPVGPETLVRLASHLAALGPDHPALTAATWFVVPHVNPDGREANRPWSDHRFSAPAADGSPDLAFDVGLYLREVVRERPGEDIEFGFPRGPQDRGARPENRVVARFLAAAAPLAVHGSFHGMGLASGPWFLLEAAWVERTSELRRALRRRVRAMGYRLLDVDRGGEKGFTRIDEGFSTRPDSRAMRDHFLARDDPETAARFRPSSMELARSLGGDPLTFVTENPLFLQPSGAAVARDELAELAGRDPEAARRQAAALGIRPMPIGDQMRLQLAFLNEALGAVEASPL